jgi:hypothetical protein
MATSSVSPPDPESTTEDAELPDPSRASVVWAATILGATLAIALLADLSNLDKDPPFDPKAVPGGGVAIFAGFIAASVVVERLLELVAPFVPWWDHGRRGPGTQAGLAQKKADRGYAMITLAALLGTVASAATGLYLADAIGLSIARWGDILMTGLAVGGGANALHQVIKSLQKAKGSGTSPG